MDESRVTRKPIGLCMNSHTSGITVHLAVFHVAGVSSVMRQLFQHYLTSDTPGLPAYWTHVYFILKTKDNDKDEYKDKDKTI